MICLLKPLNTEIGRQPATIVWLIVVVLATFFLREWLANGRLERIDATWIGAPGRLWRRFHDRFEHVFLTLGALHALAIFVGILVGIAQTGPVARALVVGFVALIVPFTIWATIVSRREIRIRAQRLAERELRYARSGHVRRLDDFGA